jgi:hypothetical protein
MHRIMAVFVCCTTYLLAGLLMPVMAQDLGKELRIGTFKSVQGTVTLQTKQTSSFPVPGDALMSNQRIVTAPQSAASLVLSDGTILVISPNSSIDMAFYQYDPVTQSGGMLIDLLSGSLRVISGWLGKLHPDQVKVRSPNAITGVRGTDFIVQAP